MALPIQTNIPSLTAQRNLRSNKGTLETAQERLSTGLRINSARDDAAGLAIADRMTSQIRGLNQATRNTNDGISMTQTAEGALSTVASNMQRIRELAVQAANGTNNIGDRIALDNEVQTLISEINRVAFQTEFNGMAILDGTLSPQFFQVGANQGQTIAVTGANARPTNLGASETVGQPGFTQAQMTQPSVDLNPPLEIQIVGPGGAAVETITIDNNDFAPPLGTAGAFYDMDDILAKINEKLRDAAEASPPNPIVRAANLKASFRVLDNGNTTIVVNGAFDTGQQPAPQPVFRIGGGEIGFAPPAAPPTVGPLFGGLPAATEAGQVALAGMNIQTIESAHQTIAAIDGALAQITAMRAEFGAAQTRFEAATDNQTINSTNTSAARMRIRDADFAVETARLVSAQILEQSSISVLVQANAAPQITLSLLQQQ